MTIDLNGVWRLDSPRYENLRVNVPGSVMSALLEHHLIDDPFYGENEVAVREQLFDNYTFTRNFSLSPEQLEKTNFLVLSGIDTVADVFVNDYLVAKLLDMHTDKKIRLDNELLKSDNSIKIVFTSPYRYIEEYDDQGQFASFAVSQPKGPCLRKPHYMFGWDWGPDLADMGIWGGVRILSTDLGYMEDFRHECTFLPDGSVRVDVQVNTVRLGSGVLDVHLSLDSDGTDLHQQLPLEDSVGLSFVLKDPKRWYPIGFGEPTLYNLDITLTAQTGEKQEHHYRIGIRQIEVDHSADVYGTNFAVSVNGYKVFLKGSCFIPEDSFLSRITPERTKRLLKLIKDFNHNAIRIWGGGYYPAECFYDYCDEHGILVWQDLMFACAAYSMKHEQFKQLIIEETILNIKRIRHHASLAIITGDNECEDGVNGHEPHLMENYRVMSLDVLVPLMKELTSVYFGRTSPRSVEMFRHQNDLEHYDTHYWQVWCDDQPIEDYEKVYPRMLSEVGHQSLPMLETIGAFAEPKDMTMNSSVMLHHQKREGCNQRIVNYIREQYGQPETFEDMVYLSQLMQADAMRLCAEHLRCHKERCNGMLYWQLNDCWPGITWSSVDYFFGVKALHYASRRFYAPHLVSVKRGGEQLEIWVSNDTAQTATYMVLYQHLTFDGVLLQEDTVPLMVEAASCENALTVFTPFADGRDDTFVYVCLKDREGTLLSENYFQAKKDRDISYPTPTLTVRQLDERSISISSDTFAKSVFVHCPDVDTVLTDNFFCLKAGETKIIIADRPIDLSKIQLKCVNYVIKN